MAAMDSLSSCDPQANCQPEPPMAQAPQPTRVMCRSELPSLRICISVSFQSSERPVSSDHLIFAALFEPCGPSPGRTDRCFSERTSLVPLLVPMMCLHMFLAFCCRL